MTARNRTHMRSDETNANGLTPTHLSKQEFARRLYNLMIGKGWNQSELGRRSGIARDSISTYVRGETFPTHINLIKLASALGVAETELLPNRIESAIDADWPALEMKVSPGEPRKAWLRVNQYVSTATAAKIVELLNAELERPPGDPGATE